MLRSQPDAGSSLSQSRPRGFCFMGTFSPSAPDPLDAITPDLPTGVGKQ
jgi:hypothetical protein